LIMVLYFKITPSFSYFLMAALMFCVFFLNILAISSAVVRASFSNTSNISSIFSSYREWF